MKLLLVAPFPYGRTSGQGGATLCFNSILALAKVHEVSVLCFNSGTEHEKADLKILARHVSSVQSLQLKISKPIVIKAKLRSLLGSTPEHVVYFESVEFRAALASAIEQLNPDVIVTQFPQMAQYLDCCNSKTTVHEIQDAYSVSWYRRAKSERNLFRSWYAHKQWWNWLNYERKYYPQASQCWALSEQDRYGLTVFNPQLNVVNLGLALTDTFAEPQPVNALRVGFLASFGHPPNLEALRFLIKEIVPRVTRHFPEVKFVIAGRNPPSGLVNASPGNVEFAGYVDSLSEFYGNCAVVVAPLLSGGGVKIKVAEALCFGKAVVTTSVGAEGIPLTNHVNAFIEDDPERFADAVILLLESPADRNQMALAAIQTARSVFSTVAWSKQAELHLNKLFTRRSLAQPNE